MSRGFKKSIPDTKAAGFLDKRSFRSVDGHDLLYGLDKAKRRIYIYRDRNPDNIDWFVGHWHHLSNEHNQGRRCDCIEGGIFISKAQHRKEHVGVRWTPKDKP